MTSWQQEEWGKEGDGGGGEEVAPLLKSRDPHLAGGENFGFHNDFIMQMWFLPKYQKLGVESASMYGQIQ